MMIRLQSIARAAFAVFAVFAAFVVTTSRARAQGVPTITLGRALAEHPEGVTQPGGARELRDGRLLLFDTREQRLLVLDFASGEANDVARQGSGPLEFRMIGGILLSGDSILVPDFLQQRFLVLSTAGVPLGTRPIMGKGTDVVALARGGDRRHRREAALLHRVARAQGRAGEDADDERYAGARPLDRLRGERRDAGDPLREVADAEDGKFAAGGDACA